MSRARAALRVTVRRRWRTRVWLLVMATFGGVAGLFPLFGTLGYELAFASALLTAAMGLDVGGALARELARAPEPGATRPGRLLAASTLAASGLAVALALVPALIATARGLVVTTCDWSFGLLAYAAMPLATAALAGAFGHALGVLLGPRRFGPAAAITVLPYLALLVAAGLRFYGAPPVFSYSPIAGYFPGNLYDENVQLTAPLAWARLEQLAWVVALVALLASLLDAATVRVRLRRPALGPAVVAALALAGALGLYYQSGALGYRIDPADIEAELAGRLETAHFVIHYAHTKEIDRDIALIAEDHELRYAEVVAQIGVAPAGKLTSFYFADRDQKGRWMGARDVEMAKPWRREIYVDHRAFPHSSLRHEIAHAVASEFGDPLFGVATKRVAGIPMLVNPGLIEGLAVALDWPGGYDRLTPHEAVRAMQAMGMEPTLDDLLSLRFFAVSSARGYTTAGSFLHFLLERYGAAPLRALYGTGGDFEAAYGKPLPALEGEWKAMLATIAVPPEAIEGSRERFRGTSVFSRPCPHAIAAAREQAVAAFVTGDRAGALALMRDVCRQAPEEPRYRLELGDYLVGGTPAERAEATALWQHLVDAEADAPDVTSSLRADASEKLARVAAQAGDRPRVTTLVAAARLLSTDTNARRQLDAEAYALAYPGPAGPLLRNYFFPAGERSLDPHQWALLATLVEPDLGFAHYLVGLQRLATSDWAGAAAELARSLDLGLPGPPFVKNAARRLALAGYRSQAPALVERAAAVLAGPDMTAVEHLLAEDWRRRLGFDAGTWPAR